MLYVASGAVNAAASSHVKLAGNVGSVISGAGAGNTSMSCVATTASLPQLFAVS